MSMDCKFESALEIFVGKWKPVILFQLFTNGTMRFSQLQKAIPDISKKMLTQQLRELEYHDIVNRKMYLQVPPKVEYTLTEYANNLEPVLNAMWEWSETHLKHLSELYGEERAQGDRT
ncbi:winged helix-turn-helix transcriptional regulator [Cohnella fermenti]|uniref:Helix-turn-helix transcriptional regulator n=1 Tax=Cohnella fermenti TaxID=2565925 RepID=A0A4S4BNB1_9BACL|nr:helix-turn-helix domain-containing protein [Cohnella fermenti]THF76354.1 helix-turn-helix transcriptional regulator [Cohnella fermenti]